MTATNIRHYPESSQAGVASMALSAYLTTQKQVRLHQPYPSLQQRRDDLLVLKQKILKKQQVLIDAVARIEPLLT